MLQDAMKIDVELVPLDAIRKMRDLYRQEMNCQIIHDSWHDRGWTDSYELRCDGRAAGYGSVGSVRGKRNTTVTEFYVLPDWRAAALPLFRRLVEKSGARRVELQTNDILFTLMAYDCATRLKSEAILFHDAFATSLPNPGGQLCWRDADNEWVIERKGEVAAKGGILFHYNVPYGDIYMETAEAFRRRGYASYLVQELKRLCYEMGRRPAARCNAANHASRATLQRAGFLPCARMLTGVLPK